MKTRLYFSIILVGALAFLSTAVAQQPKPGAASPAAKPPFQPPDMSSVFSQMMNAMYTPERAIALAHFQKVYYDALVKEGFTKEEALSIVRGNQSPMMGGK